METRQLSFTKMGGGTFFDDLLLGKKQHQIYEIGRTIK